MFKKIVVPMDGSESADRAFEVALSLAKTERSQLAVCSVVDPIVISGTVPPSPAVMDLLLQDMENDARHLVAGAIERARLAGVPAIGEMILGVPFEEILNYAKRQHADAIVMGTHGHGGLKRLFLGSVAETVLRNAACPVIVVRETAKELQKA